MVIRFYIVLVSIVLAAWKYRGSLPEREYLLS